MIRGPETELKMFLNSAESSKDSTFMSNDERNGRSEDGGRGTMHDPLKTSLLPPHVIHAGGMMESLSRPINDA